MPLMIGPSPQVPCWVCVGSWLAVWAQQHAGQGRALDGRPGCCRSVSAAAHHVLYHVSVPVFQGGMQVVQEAGPFGIPCSGCSSGVVLELEQRL